jgi:hypothetical protein
VKQNKEKSANELEILLPESEATINSHKIEINPFPFADLAKVIKILTKIGSGVFGMFANDTLKFGANGNLLITPAFLECVGEMVEDHFPEVVELIAIYTDKSPEFYMDRKNGITGEDGLVLLAMIVERNYSFFMKRLASVMAELKAKQK